MTNFEMRFFLNYADVDGLHASYIYSAGRKLSLYSKLPTQENKAYFYRLNKYINFIAVPAPFRRIPLSIPLTTSTTPTTSVVNKTSTLKTKTKTLAPKD